MMGTTVWGKKLLGGYAGVKHTADKIMSLTPDLSKYNLYVEPFSGLGRTARHVNIPMVLNDMSEFANNYCRENFPNAIVNNADFKETIQKYDSEKTFFLIDPPWRKDLYDVNSLSFCDRDVYDYYSGILDIVETIKGDWFILNSADEHESKDILTKSKWETKIVVSDKKVIFGKHARTMICSNLFTPTVIEVKGNQCDICHATYEDYNTHITRPFHLNSV